MVQPAAAPVEIHPTGHRPAPRQARGPRATLVNDVAVASGVEITLLSCVMVDDSLRVYGAMRVMERHDPVLASIPVLTIDLARDGPPLRSVGAHVLPQPPIVWLAWTFDLAQAGPGAVVHAEAGTLSARIDQLELGFRTGRRTENVVGPWVFGAVPGTRHADPA